MKPLWIVICIIFSSFVYGEIKEIQQINEIERSLPDALSSTDWILFDIDYTLTMPDHPALSMAALKHNKKRFLQELEKFSDEGKEAIPRLMVTMAPSILTEPDLPHFLKTLKDRGAFVTGLTLIDTSVCPDIGEIPAWRDRELKRLGIDFSTGAERIEFSQFPPYRGTFPLYLNGVIYCNNIFSKGEVLSAFIKKSAQKPTRVFLVDDMLDNLVDVEKEMEKLGISFLGLHYVPTNEAPMVSDDVWEKVWSSIYGRSEKMAIPSGILQTGSPQAIEWAIDSAFEDSLILFDVGNVLVVPQDAILHLKYRPWVKAWFEKESIQFDKSLIKVVAKDAESKLVNDNLPAIINRAKEKAKVMALSKYWVDLPPGNNTSYHEFRLALLKKVGIDFEEPFPETAGWYNDELKAVYSKGLLQTEAALKGPVLRAFLKEIKWIPKSIVFVDDRKDQCESIAAVSEELGIPALCIYYTEGIDNTPPFNPAIADFQLRTLVKERQWVSDESAQASQELMVH